MLQMFIILSIMLLLSMILVTLSIIISKKTKYQEKLSPFECGFDMINSFRNPFSMKFFLIGIIFLIFDIEISIFLPMLINIEFTNLSIWVTTMIMFFLILILGLIYEWFLGSLNWKT